MGEVSNPAKSRSHDRGLCDFDSEVRTVDTRDGHSEVPKDEMPAPGSTEH